MLKGKKRYLGEDDIFKLPNKSEEVASYDICIIVEVTKTKIFNTDSKKKG